VLHGGMTVAALSAAKAMLHVPDGQERLILATCRATIKMRTSNCSTVPVPHHSTVARFRMTQGPQPFMRGDKRVRLDPALRSPIGRRPPQYEFRNRQQPPCHLKVALVASDVECDHDVVG
jgi:hypothetical protein